MSHLRRNKIKIHTRILQTRYSLIVTGALMLQFIQKKDIYDMIFIVTFILQSSNGVHVRSCP